VKLPDVEGWLTQAEGDLLARCCEEAPSGAIVELGSYVGLSTIVMARTGRFIHSIDPHEGTMHDPPIYPPSWDKFKNNLWLHDVHRQVIAIRACSTEVRWHSPIAFLYIDAEHTYAAAKADYEHFAPYLMEGSLVGFHDYGEPGCPGITRYVDEELSHLSMVALADHLIVLRGK